MEEKKSNAAPKRIGWIDIAKGIAILSVMLGHTVCPDWLHVYIYSFHMPLFFILSGYTLKFREGERFGSFVLRKAKTLLVPYVVFSVPCVFVDWFANFVRTGDAALNWMHQLKSMLLQWHMTEYHFYLWFLPALFCAELILYGIFQAVKKCRFAYWLPILSGIIGVIGLLYWYFLRIPLIWDFDVTLVAIGFIGVGYAWRLLQPKVNFSSIRFWALLTMFALLHLLALLVNYKLSHVSVNMYGNEYGNVFFFLIAAFSGSIFFILLSQKITSCRLLEAIGKRTLVFYCTHEIVYIVISGAFVVLLGVDLDLIIPLYGNTVGFLVCVLLMCAEALVCMPIALVIERWFPFVLGRKKKERVAVKK